MPQLITAALDRRLPGRVQVSPKLASDYLCGALLRSPLTWLFLDALDERTSETATGLKLGLADLDKLHKAARVVMTCRLREFREGDLPDAASRNLVKYELEPLDGTQQHRLIRKWFALRVPPRSTKVTEVESLIEGHDQFRDMAANGLMLTLICATAEHHDVHPDRTRRVTLYNLILGDIVRRARGVSPMLLSDPVVGRRLRLLQRIAYTFFAPNPAATLLEESEWDDAALNACEGATDF